jgi:RHS repeat-associated protein
VNGAPYSYDANGNVLSGGGRTPAWDAENRITSIGATQFSYDAFGERIKKVSASGTSLYPFGDDYEITSGIVTKYIDAPGLGLIAKRVTTANGIKTYWQHTDRLGSIQAVTDVSGQVVFRRQYRPYGETLAESGSPTESRGWIGERNDAETGLTYLHARYYDPAAGLFLSPDPIGVAGGLNEYGCADGDPINGSDPSGLCKDPPCDTELGIWVDFGDGNRYFSSYGSGHENVITVGVGPGGSTPGFGGVSGSGSGSGWYVGLCFGNCPNGAVIFGASGNGNDLLRAPRALYCLVFGCKPSKPSAPAAPPRQPTPPRTPPVQPPVEPPPPTRVLDWVGVGDSALPTSGARQPAFTLNWGPVDPTLQPKRPPSCFGPRFRDNMKKTNSGVGLLAMAPIRLGLNAFGVSGAVGAEFGMATPLQALETMIAGSPNSTIAPGSTALFGQAATVGASTFVLSSFFYAGGMTVGSAFEGYVYSLSCQD